MIPPMPTYWLNLFTPETWNEIGGIDYSVTGFRENRRARAEQVEVGDLFLCYLTGKSRFVGVLEATGGAYWDDQTQICKARNTRSG